VSGLGAPGLRAGAAVAHGMVSFYNMTSI
jgi:hypothetical protein